MSWPTMELASDVQQMDGFRPDPKKPVFVLAATNFDVEPGKKYDFSVELRGDEAPALRPGGRVDLFSLHLDF